MSSDPEIELVIDALVESVGGMVEIAQRTLETGLDPGTWFVAMFVNRAFADGHEPLELMILNKDEMLRAISRLRTEVS